MSKSNPDLILVTCTYPPQLGDMAAAYHQVSSEHRFLRSQCEKAASDSITCPVRHCSSQGLLPHVQASWLEALTGGAGCKLCVSQYIVIPGFPQPGLMGHCSQFGRGGEMSYSLVSSRERSLQWSRRKLNRGCLVTAQQQSHKWPRHCGCHLTASCSLLPQGPCRNVSPYSGMFSPQIPPPAP